MTNGSKVLIYLSFLWFLKDLLFWPSQNIWTYSKSDWKNNKPTLFWSDWFKLKIRNRWNHMINRWVKFSFSEKATKICEIVLMVLTFTDVYKVNFKTISTIAPIFVAFSENLNFKCGWILILIPFFLWWHKI